MPTIDFITYDEECLRDFKPVLAKEYLPEWWKNQKIHETNFRSFQDSSCFDWLLRQKDSYEWNDTIQ